VSGGTRGQPVGVGIVGAGQAGSQHLAALADCRDAVAVAVCDTDKIRLDDLIAGRNERNEPPLRASTSLGELLEDPRVELVALATPPVTHLELAMRVLAAGRGLLLEKPPLLTTEDLAAVLSEAAGRGLAAGVMLQHRFRLPASVNASPWSPATVAAAEVVRYRPASHYARDAWRTDPAASGGALIAHLGVHFLDIACQLLGMPREVTGFVDPIPGTSLDQRVAFTAEFGQGARLSFIGTTGVDQRAERLAVYDAGRSLTVQGPATTYEATGAAEHFTVGTAELRVKVYSDMAQAVRGRGQPRVADLRSAAGVVRLLEMIGRLPGREAQA
jgi:predicted dehydrogenase